MSGDQKNIYVLYVGGTIGMQEGDGYEVGSLDKLMGTMPELKYLPEAPRLTVVEHCPLLDSSNMGPAEWQKISLDIESKLAQFDGVVVIHGTDTMAYTASVLSFLLEGLRKPVVLTGSQLPLIRPRNDGRANLVTAIQVAANHPELQEVVVVFGGKILRGNRTTKVSSTRFEAFDSPRYPPLGTVGINIEIDKMRTSSRSDEYRVRSLLQVRTGWTKKSFVCIKVTPGMPASVVRDIVQNAEVGGVVLEGFGAGNAPTRNVEFVEALRDAIRRGVVVVDVVQPLHGRVDLNAYSVAKDLREIGVLSGYDMTTEAALTKLYYLFSLFDDDPRKVRRWLGVNLRGELSDGRSWPRARVADPPSGLWEL